MVSLLFRTVEKAAVLIWRCRDAPRPYLELRSVLAPSKAVVEDLTVPLPPLHVLSLNKERWHPALEAMLNDFVDDVMETWHLGGKSSHQSIRGPPAMAPHRRV